MGLWNLPNESDLLQGKVLPENFCTYTKRNFDILASTDAASGSSAIATSNDIATNYTPTEDTIKGHLKGINSALVGAGGQEPVNQVSHGFALGNWLKMGATQYEKAQADSSANADSIGVVTVVTDDDNFVISFAGYINVLGAVPNYPKGTVLYLSDTVAGGVTDTAPTDSGTVNKPVAIVTEPDSQMVVLQLRGLENAIDESTYPMMFEVNFMLDGLDDLLNAEIMNISCPLDGYIVASSITVNEARTAGSISAQPQINSSGIGETDLDLVINNINTLKDYKTVPYGSHIDYKVFAGDRIGFLLSSSSFQPDRVTGTLSLIVRILNP